MGGPSTPGSGGTPERDVGLATDSRGQSNVLAVALVLSLALTGALLITGIGSVTLAESKQVAESQEAVRSMTELDSRASLVALEGGSSSTFRFSSQGGSDRVATDQSGWLKLQVFNNSSDTTPRVLTNTTLGTVTYRNGKERIAYQGGGVWRRTSESNQSVMVSPPELHYYRGTLTFPVVRVVGDERGISTARISKVDQRRVFPNASRGQDWVNPLDPRTELELVVKSEYYRGWAAFFERRVGANVTVYDSNQTAHVKFIAYDKFRLDSGLISVGAGAPIDLQGPGGAPTFVDSYNSENGPYDGGNRNGTIESPGGVDLGGNSYIMGDVDTGGPVTFSGTNNTIYGNVSHQGLDDQGGTITGWNASNGTGVFLPPIDATVNNRVNEVCSQDTTDLSDGGTIDATGDGTYCHPGDLTLNDETLTIDLSGGNVSLAIDGDLELNNDATIEVTNPGDNHSARIWLAGDQFEMTSQSNVTVPDDRSPALRLYGKSGLTMRMKSQSQFVGLIFAPGQRGAGGTVEMQSNSEVYGAVVGGEIDMQGGSEVHYDQALQGIDFQYRTPPAARLAYLHVTINEIRIEER